jgi:hypothetical protein
MKMLPPLCEVMSSLNRKITHLFGYDDTTQWRKNIALHKNQGFPNNYQRQV